MTTRLEAARMYLEHGWKPIPIPSGTKGPILKGWTDLRAEPWDIERLFSGEGNIGLLVGTPSGIVDIDLDCPHARLLAPRFLPPTPMKHGRRTAPESHWWYRCAPSLPATKRYRDIPRPDSNGKREKDCLVEVRADGGLQTVVPPSVHPDTSEAIEWAGPTDPAIVDTNSLSDAVAELASACLLARNYPAQGSRHDAVMALAGALARSGWPLPRIQRLVEAAADGAGDMEAKDRLRAAKDTVEALGKKPRVTGIPRLRALMGDALVDRLIEWLRLTEPKVPKGEPQEEEALDSLPSALAALDEGAPLDTVLKDICPRIIAGDVAEVMARAALQAHAGRSDFDTAYEAAMSEARKLPCIPTLDKDTPQKTARSFLKVYHTAMDGTRLLHFHKDDFWRWDSPRYVPVSTAAIHSDLARFMEQGKLKPTQKRLNDAFHLLKCEAHVPDEIEPPAWLCQPLEGYPDLAHMVPLKTCYLDPASGRTYPATPRVMSLFALPFDYDPADASPPSEWLAFLRSLWPEDTEAIGCLQEIMGYLLTADTSFQKMFLLWGPRRSGKGTIARVIRGLLGPHNCAGPSMISLGSNFGASSLIGKTCAIIADARTSARTDQGPIVERLLAISGEDAIDIDRKNRSIVTVQLSTRIMILSNDLPRLADASSALSGRFVILRFTRSFYGEEDHSILSRVTPELPQILHWALEGRRRLYERGYFEPPSSSAEAAVEMQEAASPITAFVSERCVLKESETIPLQTLYAEWKRWCDEQGRDSPGIIQTLSAMLQSAYPEIVIKREWNGRTKARVCYGIGLALVP